MSVLHENDKIDKEPSLDSERTFFSKNEISIYSSKYKNQKADTGIPETSPGTYKR